MTSKRNDPDYTSSSFFVRKDINIAFDRVLLEMKARGEDVDRSTTLEALMAQFVATQNGTASRPAKLEPEEMTTKEARETIIRCLDALTLPFA